MSYDRGFLNQRISILNRSAAIETAFGRKGGDYVVEKDLWANFSFTKGKKALTAGSIDVYDYYMVRCDFDDALTEDSRLLFNGNTYQIENFYADKQTNECQMLVVRVQK